MLCNLFMCYLDLLAICKNAFGNLGSKHRFGRKFPTQNVGIHILKSKLFFFLVKVP